MKTFLFSLLLFSYIINNTMLNTNFMNIQGLTLTNIVVFLVALVLFISEVGTRRFLSKKNEEIKFIGMILILIICSVIYSKINTHPSLTIQESMVLFKRMYFVPLLLYVLPFFLADSKKNARRNLMLVVLSFSILNLVSLLAEGMGINLFIVQEHALHNMQEQSMQNISTRFAGFKGNGNKTAYILCLLTPFLFYFKNRQKSMFIKGVLTGFIGLNILSVLLTASRGGLLTLICVLFFFLYSDKKYKELTLMSIFGFIGMAGVFIFKFDTIIVERIQPILEGDFATGSSGRLAIWSELIRVYFSDLQTVLLGLGFGGSELVGLRADPHNFYLQMLTEFGFAGFIVLLFISVWFIMRIKFYKNYSEDSFGIYLMASVLSIGIGWLFSTLDGIMDLALLSIGIGVTYLKYQKKESEIDSA